MLVFSSELCKFQGYFVATLHPFVQAVFFPVWSAHNSLLSYMTAKHSTLTSLQNFPMTNEVVLHVNPPVSTPLESSLISFTVFWLFLVSKLNSVDESSIGYFSKYLAMEDFLKTSQFLLRVFDVHYFILNRSVPLQDFYALFIFFSIILPISCKMEKYVLSHMLTTSRRPTIIISGPLCLLTFSPIREEREREI